jgi:dTDP-4-dehydrorhamnose 3,5-epimerase-like enzyme
MAETINLPKIEDARGNLSFIEGEHHIPFAIRRAYWIYDVPGGELRGSHAFRREEEFIVALSGSFDVVLHDGVREQRIHLCRSYKGVYVPPMTWRTLDNFSTNSLGLVLSSTHYDEADYIWDFADFQRIKEQMTSACAADENGATSAKEGLAFSSNSDRSSSSKDSLSSKALDSSSEAAGSSAPRLYTLDDCHVLQLPSLTELRRGCLTPIEGTDAELQSECTNMKLPFPLRRVFYLYDIPSGADRGQHAHKQAWQFIVAASSCFSIDLDDGEQQRTVRLDRPFRGLLIPPGIWCRLHDFSSAAVALVLTSEHYDPSDYICDYTQLQEFRRQLK